MNRYVIGPFRWLPVIGMFYLGVLLPVFSARAQATRSAFALKEPIMFEQGGKGVLFTPRSPRRARCGIVFLPDEFGLDSAAQSWIMRFCETGVPVLAIDVFGRVPEDEMEAHELERALPDGLVSDLGRCAASELIRRDSTLCGIVLIGLGFGATAALDLLLHTESQHPTQWVWRSAILISPALPPYLLAGHGHEIPQDTLLRLRGLPMHIHFGASDRSLLPEAIVTFQKALTHVRSAHAVEVRLHHGARRQFMRAQSGEALKARLSVLSRGVRLVSDLPCR